tara:strand:+ start:1649 stop:1915 length:267 start_codon:yes stop_codon:yes gene_type:complete
VFTHPISVCGYLAIGSPVNQELECFVRYWVVGFWIYFQRRKMDKLNKAYDDLFKQIIPKSPLDEALRRFKETGKQIRKDRYENSRTSR